MPTLLPIGRAAAFVKLTFQKFSKKYSTYFHSVQWSVSKCTWFWMNPNLRVLYRIRRNHSYISVNLISILIPLVLITWIDRHTTLNSRKYTRFGSSFIVEPFIRSFRSTSRTRIEKKEIFHGLSYATQRSRVYKKNMSYSMLCVP